MCLPMHTVGRPALQLRTDPAILARGDRAVRKDLQHLLVERGRFGSARRSRKTALRLGPGSEDCDATLHIAAWGRGGYGYWDGKDLNENLAPLQRFLEKSVGRSWNKVYSEIREQLDHRRATGLH